MNEELQELIQQELYNLLHKNDTIICGWTVPVKSSFGQTILYDIFYILATSKKERKEPISMEKDALKHV